MFDLLCAIGRPFSEEVVQLIVAYVLIGLDTLHTHKFAHQVCHLFPCDTVYANILFLT